MHRLWIALLPFLMIGCDGEESPRDVPVDRKDTVLQLPEIVAGTNVDTLLSWIRIAAVKNSDRSLTSVAVTFSGDSLRDTVNIYADSSLSAWMTDSIVHEFCEGKDLRLIGSAHGFEVAIPFHWTSRFIRTNDSLQLPPNCYHPMLLRPDEIELYPDDTAYNGQLSYANVQDYFGKFYGDAFNPVDPTGFPERQPMRQTIAVLAMEGQNWDMVQLGVAPDTAAQLAAYNEFVNKLEIYDKVGEFNRMPKAVIDISYYPTFKWGKLLHVLSEHYKAQRELRNSAKTYLADKIANEGKPVKEFTDEDQLLLYPDRLRWSGWMSGTTEHYYDPFHLNVHSVAPTPQVKVY